MSPRTERFVRALVIVALGMLGGFLLFRSKPGAAKAVRRPCAQCPAARACPAADLMPEKSNE